MVFFIFLSKEILKEIFMCQSNRIWLENGCDLFYGVNNVKRVTRTPKKMFCRPEVWDSNPIKKINFAPTPTRNFRISIGYAEFGIRLGRAWVRE